MSSSIPILSIITVVYNGQAVIEETINSVLTFKKNSDVEFIVIDGQSKDRTVSIIDKYASDIDVLVSEKDSGIYDAMNKAAFFAKGKYAIFINAGDRILSNCKEDVLTALANKDFDVVYGDVLLNEKGITKPISLHHIRYTMPFCHQATFVKTELLKNYPFNKNFRIASDFDLFLNLFIAQKSFYYIAQPIAYFEGGGVSAGVSKKYVIEYSKVIWRNNKNEQKLISLIKFWRNVIFSFLR